MSRLLAGTLERRRTSHRDHGLRGGDVHLSLNDLNDLLQTGTVADLCGRARRVAQALEFEHFIYGLRLHLSDGASHDLVISGYPAAWRTIYEQENYLAIDPTVRHCLRSGLPLAWSESVFVDAEAAAMMETARRFGLCSGLTMPIHSAHRQTGLLSLVSARADETLGNDMALLAQAKMFATYLHEAARALAERRERAQYAACRLTPREKECLTWAAAGKTSWEIGQITSSAERTVNYHIGNVMQKLNVRSRSQAVARALLIGLINL